MREGEISRCEVSGQFIGFQDVGIENDICLFDGAGPCNVARDIVDMVHGWNCLREVGEAYENPRQNVEWEPRAGKIGAGQRIAEDHDDD